MPKSNVNDRAQQVLKLLVECYIRDGQPVGSKRLAGEKAIALSSASIRNIMADLEAAGLLVSPHTSAGRIPTAKGYRLFVDSLLHVRPLETPTVEQLQRQLDIDASPKALIKSASSLLSGMTCLAGVVTLPRRKETLLRQVEFLPLSNNRILVILVLNTREVQNRIIYTDRTYNESELQQAGNYLTQHYAGRSLSDIRDEILSALKTDRRSIVDIAKKTFEDDKKSDDDFIMAGESHLFNIAENNNVDQLKTLFDAFSQKRDILHLLDKSLKTDGVQIFIGEEAGYNVLQDCSVITAPYSTNGQVVGVLGVIGPTRMAYDRAISAVDVTAKLLGSALEV